MSESQAKASLRKLQILDERCNLGPFRYLLIEAENILGNEIGLACTGKPDGWNEDGSIAFYSHDGDTCPIHEWLVPADCPTTSEPA